jgi:glycosyltransferase involved in cell wall biosynthesis
VTVAAVIPTIPGREQLLEQAIRSVQAQTRQPDESHIVQDTHRQGAAWARNQALADAGTDWVAFLDDDDEWLPHHLEVLLDCAEATGADVVYPHFTVAGGTVDLPRHCGDPFDPDLIRRANWIPVTTLGGFPTPGTVEWPLADAEDWGFLIRLVDAGAKFMHLPLRTWIWHQHDAHTRGRPCG